MSSTYSFNSIVDHLYRWQNTAKREQLFETLIKTFTKFEIERVGLGTATSERIERYHETPSEKFDYIIRYNNKEYYVDVSGAWKYPPWIQMSKPFNSIVDHLYMNISIFLF